MKRIVLAALAFALAAGAAEAKTVTKPCKKNLSIGAYDFDMAGISEDWTFNVVKFVEKSRDASFAYGTCTIVLKYQPPD
ncbi:MAG: hypothetical protein WDN03_17010 [Rhizomicrobium sp.]